MADIHVTVGAQTAEAEASIEALLRKYNNRKINLIVTAKGPGKMLSPKNLRKQIDKPLQKHLNNLSKNIKVKPLALGKNLIPKPSGYIRNVIRGFADETRKELTKELAGIAKDGEKLAKKQQKRSTSKKSAKKTAESTKSSQPVRGRTSGDKLSQSEVSDNEQRRQNELERMRRDRERQEAVRREAADKRESKQIQNAADTKAKAITDGAKTVKKAQDKAAKVETEAVETRAQQQDRLNKQQEKQFKELAEAAVKDIEAKTQPTKKDATAQTSTQESAKVIEESANKAVTEVAKAEKQATTSMTQTAQKAVAQAATAPPGGTSTKDAVKEITADSRDLQGALFDEEKRIRKAMKNLGDAAYGRTGKFMQKAQKQPLTEMFTSLQDQLLTIQSLSKKLPSSGIIKDAKLIEDVHNSIKDATLKRKESDVVYERQRPFIDVAKTDADRAAKEEAAVARERAKADKAAEKAERDAAKRAEQEQKRQEQAVQKRQRDARDLQVSMLKADTELTKSMKKFGDAAYGSTGKYMQDAERQPLRQMLDQMREARSAFKAFRESIPSEGIISDEATLNSVKSQLKALDVLKAESDNVYEHQREGIERAQNTAKEVSRQQAIQQKTDKRLADKAEQENARRLVEQNKASAKAVENIQRMDDTFQGRIGNAGQWKGWLDTNQIDQWNAAVEKAAVASRDFDNLKKKTEGRSVTTSEAQEFENISKRLNDAQQSLLGFNREYTAHVRSLKGANNEAVYFDKMGAKMSDYYTKWGHNLQRNSRLYNDFINLQNKANNGQFASMGDANRQWASFRTEARKAGVEVDTFGSKLQRTFGSRIRSATAGMGVYMIQGALTGIVNNAKEVDTAMTELKKVTTETDATYDKFLSNAGTRAQSLGATLRDTVSATADFARLGFDVEEATKLADSALIYKNVGDDVNDIDQASKSLISTMQGFGIQANDSMRIVDEFNEV